MQTIILSFFPVIICLATTFLKADTIFSFEKFMSVVKEHHPLAITANIQVQKGTYNLLNARGSFDPKLYSDLQRKEFDDKEYYHLWNNGLKIPTWFGLEAIGGYEQNQGTFVNPENNTPNAGLWYAGISLPLGQGLFIDKRRAELRKAQIYLESTEAERKIMLNNLLYEAGKAYWDWFMNYNSMKIYENALELAQQRFEAVKLGASLGDRPSIDTIESSIQVQNRKLSLQQAQLDFKNSTALVAIYLWINGEILLDISPNTRPPFINEISLLNVDNRFANIDIDTMISRHPEFQQYLYKIDQIEIDIRMKREMLKPILNLKYNAITEPVGGDILAGYNSNDYQFGLQFNVPLFLRRERADLKMTNINMMETELGLTNKNAELKYKINYFINEWETTVDQIVLYQQTVKDYNTLLNGERQMFDAGESSLFMVNSRELGYINAQIKLTELLTKNRKSGLASDFALGILWDNTAQ